MTSSINSIIQVLESGPSQLRSEAIMQLKEFGDEAVEPVAKALKRKLAPEKATLIRHYLSLLTSDDLVTQFDAAETLLSFGYHVLDFLEEEKDISIDNELARRVISELKAVEAEGTELSIGEVTARPETSSLADWAEEALIELTKPAIIMTDEDRRQPLSSSKVLAFLEINNDARKRAKRQLLNLGDSAIDALIRALADDNAQVRRIAAQMLVLFPTERTTQPLLDALEDTDVFVRSTVVDALSKKGKQALLPMANLLVGSSLQ